MNKEYTIKIKNNPTLSEILEEHKDTSKIDLIYKIEKLKDIVYNALQYNDYLKEHCKYKLNTGHLRKMEKILKGE